MSENVDSHEGEVSPEVYRRRRIVAALVLVLVILLGVALVSFLTSRGDSSNTDAAATSASSTSAEAFSDFSQRATESATAEASESESAEAEESEAPEESASASEEAESSESTEPAESESAEPTAEASEEPSETPAVLAACKASDLQVTLSADSASYGAGQYPALAVTYTNASGNPCIVTGGTANVDVNITSGPAQVYNYAQCHANPGTDAEIEAGATSTTPLTWNRSLNVLGCATSATVQPGHYWATASVNGVTSQPVRIIITG